MPKVKYTDWKPKPEGRALVEAMNEILEGYGGMVLTARQLYYQFVARDLLPASWADKATGSTNNVASYKKLTDLLSQARLAGMVDWDMIEDRGRVPQQPADWASIVEIAEVAAAQFRLPRWDGQAHYIELWVEKAALAGVLEPLAREYHVTLMVNRGYSSQSAMRESALRFSDRVRALTQKLRAGDGEVKPVLLYLGDHDPSGKDMRRDIVERMALFGVDNLTVDMIALSTAQVKEYKPPPNPAKVSDPRAKGYIKEFGTKSWELDALPPRILQELVRKAIERRRDKAVFGAVVREEDRQRNFMRKAMQGLTAEGFASVSSDPADAVCAHPECNASGCDIEYCDDCRHWICDEHVSNLRVNASRTNIVNRHNRPACHWDRYVAFYE